MLRGRLFKSYNLKSWSFKPDSTAVYPPIYNGYNWSSDNIRVKKRNKATCFKIFNHAINRMKVRIK